MTQSTEFSRQNFPPRSMRHAAKLLVIVIFVGMTLTAMSGQAAQLYISPTGSDSHPCTQALPCLTLQHAVNVASSGDTINIEAGTYATDVLIFKKNLTILGPGASNTILQGFGKNTTFVLKIDTSFVTISGVTITRGGSSAIQMLSTDLVLENCVVSDSFGRANDIYGPGGGISNSYGHLTLKGTTITNNQRGLFGGGIDNIGGVITVIESTISANSGSNGGGIRNFNGLTAVSQSTISGNSGSNGGGIWSSGGALEVLNSTIAGNTAAINGGGIEVEDGSKVQLDNATIVGNTAADGLSGGTGGGINVAQIPSGVTVSNTILALNITITSLSSPPIVIPIPNDCSDTLLLSSGYNLFAFLGNCVLLGPGSDRTNVNPKLGSLQNNGGPTETMLPLTGSPAIDAGNPAGCTDAFGSRLTVDQRGLPRPDAAEPRCDIGAVEVQ